MPAKKKKKAQKKKVAPRKKAAPKKKIARKAVKRKAVLKTRKKKPVLKKAKKAKKPAPLKKPKEKGTVVGLITHYFPHVQAAVTKLKGPLSVGDTIKIKGHTTDFTQTVTSMQIDHVIMNNAGKGDEIGLQVSSRVRQHDTIYKL